MKSKSIAVLAAAFISLKAMVIFTEDSSIENGIPSFGERCGSTEQACESEITRFEVHRPHIVVPVPGGHMVMKSTSDPILKEKICKQAVMADMCMEKKKIDRDYSMLVRASAALAEVNPEVAEQLIEQAEIQLHWKTKAEEYCGAKNAISPERAFETIYEAARSGDARSKVKFSLGHYEIDENGGPVNQSHEFHRLRRLYAHEMLRTAADSGDVEALYALYNAHIQGYIGYGGNRIEIRKDNAIGLAAGRILLQIVPENRKSRIELQLASLRSTADTSDLARSERIRSRYAMVFIDQFTDEITGYAVHQHVADPCSNPGRN